MSETEGSQLDRFAASSMRGPKRGIYQQLLAQLLIKANRSNDPLIKVSCICEAGLMSRNKKSLDMKLVNACYKVCQSFKSTEIVERPRSFLHRKQMIAFANVTWVFPKTEENYNKYIKDWHCIGVFYYPLSTSWRREKHPFTDRLGGTVYGNRECQEYYNRTAAFLESVADKVDEEFNALPEWQRFFEMTSAVGKRSVRVLEGEFSGWALPQLLETQATLSDEIDPDIWKETLSAVSKDEKKENVE